MQAKTDQVSERRSVEALGASLFDLSIILNVHDEARYLRRTMRSLEEAAMFAQRDGSTIELVVVLDNPDRATHEWIDRCDFSYFDAHQKITVHNGSLGASRNDGVRVARGRLLVTADGDDLVSYNMYSNLLSAARAGAVTNVYVPEYVFVFEDENSIKKYFSSEHLPHEAFFDLHPYCSRVCADAELFRKLPYHDIQRDDVCAFEDWHFNCEAIAVGCSIVTTPDTILFYRRRQNSIMNRLEAPAQAIIPPSSYFQPSNYVSQCHGKRAGLSARTGRAAKQGLLALDELTSEMIELVATANAIDPGISWETLHKDRLLRTNLVDATPAGTAYLHALEQIGEDRFTDVVLLDGVSVGGAEKFIFDIIGTLRTLGASRKILVLSNKPLKHTSHRLPEECTVVDLFEACGSDEGDTINLVTLRIIQAVSKGATLHLKSNEYSRYFLERFGRHLREETVVFYYFADSVALVNAARITQGFHFGTVSTLGTHIDLVVSDHERILRELRATLDHLPATRIGSIYAKVDVAEVRDIGMRKPTRRLLWASRVSAAKRPELLVKIAHGLARSGSSVHIDAYGQAQISTKQLKSAPQVSYCGAYSSFDELRPENYDGFLYTSAFDGLPNVILEAMAHGLPVIAPDVGGISEVITDATGFLIEDDADDDVLVGRYLAAIDALSDPSTDLAAKLGNAHALLAERHSAEAHLARVSELFNSIKKLPDDCSVPAREFYEVPHGQVTSRMDADQNRSQGGEMKDQSNLPKHELETYVASLEQELRDRDAVIHKLRRDIQDQRARTLRYARKVKLHTADQRDISKVRLLWRRMRARLGLPRLGSLKRGFQAFTAVVFRGRL